MSDRITTREYTDQALAIATLAGALAAGTVIGPRWAAVRLLEQMASTLMLWTADDRSGV